MKTRNFVAKHDKNKGGAHKDKRYPSRSSFKVSDDEIQEAWDEMMSTEDAIHYVIDRFDENGISYIYQQGSSKVVIKGICQLYLERFSSLHLHHQICRGNEWYVVLRRNMGFKHSYVSTALLDFPGWESAETLTSSNPCYYGSGSIEFKKVIDDIILVLTSDCL